MNQSEVKSNTSIGAKRGKTRASESRLVLVLRLAPVVQKLDSAIHRINHYPVDNATGFPITYPLDSDLSGG